MNDRIRVSVADHVAEVRLVRSDKMNALDGAMFDSLLAAGTQLRARADVRAIVLSGEGRAFCAGLDLSQFEAMAQRGADLSFIERKHGFANMAQQVVLQWRQMPVPVIAAIHGVAFGGGLQLALGADIRVVHPAARLSIMEVRWGLVPDMGGILLLRDLIRPDVAADLIYSGRQFDGQEALALGLATRVSEDPGSAAVDLAKSIAGNSPDAIRAAKRLLLIDDPALTQRILSAEADEQRALVSRPNQIEAVRAAQEGRVAQFVDPAAGDFA
ncbi:crotonase/enoyl-CoA hydratase family protein [Novosphingobium cyanobacteriorum]|uniref:Crotonase/enoyl-CoA hydratase family protein n=1 Tax=Novosphingobium cyanobacteriorum TaxID=3024215 RepID=A0ABT6CEH8_9SPHN|nr:crotonase/enoyl-CoA hydratase family protein [Novosphingobium cyanobacteriorum]MDF8332206.1 crotonase/enoyl-CoA hydratase family protein [Novosphingobium cyanobacteriorum]